MNLLTSPSLTFLPSLVSAIGWALIHFLWQGFLVGAVTAVLLQLLRNAAPQTRYITGCGALLVCFLLPLFEAASRLQEHAGTAVQLTTVGVQIDTTLHQFDWHQLAFWLQSHVHGIVLVWLVCVALLSVRMGLGLWWLRGYSKDQRSRSDAQWQTRLTALAVKAGLPYKIVLRVVDDLESPITIGWLRPLVLVPASLITGMPAHLLEALLAHELAHISRFDYLINLIQSLIEILLFFHPAVWWISKRICIEREQIADDIAAGILGEPRRLALALQELALCRFSHNQLAQAANGGNLMSRIKRLVRPEVQPVSWKAAAAVIGVTAVCFSLYAHAGTPAASDAPKGYTGPKFDDTVKCEKPGYPQESRKKGEEGTVTASFLIGETGNVLQSKIKKSSGFPALDEAVTGTFAKCTYTPAMKDGKAQEAWKTISYVWKLE
ncbi:TonB family protein [Undibacterium sp.]|uniref:TonB family protein n=1 Tax=Undibacterium sp. TaxID=1914977 RepID=UPI00374D2B1D